VQALPQHSLVPELMMIGVVVQLQSRVSYGIVWGSKKTHKGFKRSSEKGSC
jgi:hypothetical protein